MKPITLFLGLLCLPLYSNPLPPPPPISEIQVISPTNWSIEVENFGVDSLRGVYLRKRNLNTGSNLKMGIKPVGRASGSSYYIIRAADCSSAVMIDPANTVISLVNQHDSSLNGYDYYPALAEVPVKNLGPAQSVSRGRIGWVCHISSFPNCTDYRYYKTSLPTIGTDNDTTGMIRGSIEGFVYDLNGRTVPRLTVQWRRADPILASSYEITTDSLGHYQLNNIVFGDIRTVYFHFQTPSVFGEYDTVEYPDVVQNDTVRYDFHLKQAVTKIEKPAVAPGAARILSAAPNPFTGRTAIVFTVSEAVLPVRLGAYAVDGREVRSLYAQLAAAGTYTVIWDGADNAGKPLPSGTYACRLQVGDKTISQSITVRK